VPNSAAQQEPGGPLLDPNARLGAGGEPGAHEPVAPTAPPAPDLVAAASPEAPAPQVEPGAAEAQPGDFAGPAPGEEPEGAVFDDAHRDGEESGFNDDAI